MSPDQDGLIIHFAVPVNDPTATASLTRLVNRALRDVHTAVCSGWTHTNGHPKPQPHLTTWLNLDIALVLTHLYADRALVELHIRTHPTRPTPPGDHPTSTTPERGNPPRPETALPPYR